MLQAFLYSLFNSLIVSDQKLKTPNSQKAIAMATLVAMPWMRINFTSFPHVFPPFLGSHSLMEGRPFQSRLLQPKIKYVSALLLLLLGISTLVEPKLPSSITSLPGPMKGSLFLELKTLI